MVGIDGEDGFWPHGCVFSAIAKWMGLSSEVPRGLP